MVLPETAMSVKRNNYHCATPLGPVKSLCAAMETRGLQFHQELVGGSEAYLLTMMLNNDAVTES